MKYYKRLLITLALILTFILNNTFVFAKPTNKPGSLPTAPTLLTYSGITTNGVTLSWQAVSRATGYKVYKAILDDSNYTLIATVSTNSYMNTDLASNTKYWYFVRAYNSYGTSTDSTHINITTIQAASVSKKLVLGPLSQNGHS